MGYGRIMWAVLSLRHHCTITVPSLHPSLHHHCTITAPSLRHHCTITTPGFPACCNAANNTQNVPLDPEKFAAAYPQTLQDLRTHWPDPVQSTMSDSLCYLHNHEWQKHGYCAGVDGFTPTNLEASAHQYFTTAINKAKELHSANAQFAMWATQSAQVTLAQINALYATKPQVYCSTWGDEVPSLHHHCILTAPSPHHHCTITAPRSHVSPQFSPAGIEQAQHQIICKSEARWTALRRHH